MLYAIIWYINQQTIYTVKCKTEGHTVDKKPYKVKFVRRSTVKERPHTWTVALVLTLEISL